jgi:hypothetical protein
MGISVPEGHSRLAQCFNIGITDRNRISPEGTAENPVAIQPSLRDLHAFQHTHPTLKTLGYFQMSLRDKFPRLADAMLNGLESI